MAGWAGTWWARWLLTILMDRTVGAIISIYLATLGPDQRNRSIVGVVFGAALVLWMTGFLEFWKRKSATLAFRVGHPAPRTCITVVVGSDGLCGEGSRPPRVLCAC